MKCSPYKNCSNSYSFKENKTIFFFILIYIYLRINLYKSIQCILRQPPLQPPHVCRMTDRLHLYTLETCCPKHESRTSLKPPCWGGFCCRPSPANTTRLNNLGGSVLELKEARKWRSKTHSFHPPASFELCVLCAQGHHPGSSNNYPWDRYASAKE